MKLKFNMPVNLKFGTGVIKDNSEEFKLGKKAFLVTGKNSARLSGALDDILDVLKTQNISYEIFDKVENNPNLENVTEGTSLCKKVGGDFIIAVGGGSPLDAAKAIAALSTNDINAIDLLDNKFENPFLPIIAVPTTSGTGSEVTPYSVLTIPSMNTKRSFMSQWSYPKIAFADPTYTYSLPYNITVDTAFDAFSHLFESYCSLRSTRLNDAIAIEGIQAFAECMKNIADKNITNIAREKLMYASCLGGIAISHTGTTLIHAMGYSLTYFKGFSHGRANAMLMAEYLKENSKIIPDKVQTVMDILGFKSFKEADKYFSIGLDLKPILSDEECRSFAKLANEQGSVKLNPVDVKEDDIFNLYKRIFGGAKGKVTQEY